MGRGRLRKLPQKDQAEEILHGISTSSNGGKTHQAPLTEIQLSTPEGMAVVVSDKDKGKQGREEEWPELTHQRGSGGGTQKTPVEVNGTVNRGNNVGNAQRKLNHPEVIPEKPWANLFSTNRLAARGMNLNYIAPIIVEGEKVVEIMPEDVAEDDMKWAPSVVVYVVGVTPSIGAMERFIIEHGPFSIKPVVLYHSDGYFVVRFANEEERNKMLCAGPHYLLKRPVIMKPWLPEFNFKEETLTTIPLWIKLPNLPLNCWNSVVLSKIGSSLEKPLYADECTTQASRISFARILIEMDVTRPLPKMIKIRDPKGKVLEQQVWYEWKPLFCQKCLQVGHSCVDKPKVIPAKRGRGQGQRKEWRQTTIRDKNQEKQTEQ
ncbi:hypothetical protein KY290_017201 [Solanum tuberosum]|uniref:DUF4283 domain-containing protein n=1 Tax=Solanum tuberosum TaxID=4113 RepID=A0ABQ7VBJ4_SOLTU|nr:hypothetical protein KY284_016237 [Solanum tuberosum]KAH0701965.1 hypothetical protein KY285_016243 [Solanum tuberosum]KAH0761128.1 hypothetical protein KY290_017201 [Solanum tuberosum]